MSIVSIIVPCYNEQETITLLLDAIHQQTFPLANLEVVIADGMSSDDTRGKVLAFSKEHPDLMVRLVENQKRIIPAGLNRAIESSNGEIIIRLDAHSMPAKDYVERIVADLQAGLGDNVGGTWDIQPGGKGWMAASIALAASHPLGVGDARYRYSNHAGEVDTVPFGAYKRKIFKKIGQYDERLQTNEDYELNMRLKKANGRIWLDPAIRTVYFARPDLSGLARQYFRYGYWKWRMLRKYLYTVRWRQAIPPLFLLSLVVLSLVSIWMAPARILLTVEVGLYLLLLLIAAIPLGIRKKDGRLIIGVPLAVITMHLCWGAGFWVSMVKSLVPSSAKGVK